uniref:Uncharacterized protein n=1 Tax=Triticum aestivum TaxID=4565 RepID=A0A080YTX0_WHEAT|nr:unnamed protein product [Triticum aestivum]
MALELTAPCQATRAQSQPIYDTEDHELTALYIWKSGCPRNVNLAPCDDSTSSRSVAVSIKLAAATNGSDKEAPPRLSTDVVIEFGDTVNKCKQRLQWYIGADGRDQKFIFRVERHHGAYKLTSCYAPGCKHEP